MRAGHMQSFQHNLQFYQQNKRFPCKQRETSRGRFDCMKIRPDTCLFSCWVDYTPTLSLPPAWSLFGIWQLLPYNCRKLIFRETYISFIRLSFFKEVFDKWLISLVKVYFKHYESTIRPHLESMEWVLQDTKSTIRRNWVIMVRFRNVITLMSCIH